MSPNKSMQRTTPAPHNVMALAIRFTCSGARVTTFGYHVLVRGVGELDEFHDSLYGWISEFSEYAKEFNK